MESKLLQKYKKRRFIVNSMLSNLGVNISLDYAKYQAIKGDKGDYVDFLLQYDSLKAEDGDDSWMNSIFGSSDLLDSMPPELWSKLDSKATASIFSSSKSQESTSLLIDEQVSAMKMQLIEAFRQRIEGAEKNETVKAAKIAALYEQAASVRVPSRFLG